MLSKGWEQSVMLPAKNIVESLIDRGLHISLAIAYSDELRDHILRPVGNAELSKHRQQ